MVNDILKPEEEISRTIETILAIFGGVSGIVVGLIFIIMAFTTPVYDTYYYEPEYWSILFGIISIAGGVIGLVSGAIFRNSVQIASILAIVACLLCLIGGIFVLGNVGFTLLLIAGILGFVRK